MLIEFDKDYLLELYEKGVTTDKKHRFQYEIVRRYQKCVTFLKWSERIEDLYRINSLNYENLQGNKAGISSVRINKQYRLEFKVRKEGTKEIITICRLLDISNHYK